MWTALFDDEEVMRFIGDGRVRDAAYYVQLVTRQQRLAEATGLCLFTVTANGRVVGFAGIHPWSHDWGPRGSLEVGWRLGREFWGHGHATEAALAAIGLARGRGVLDLVSMIQQGNAASVAVARKLGMVEHAVHQSPEGTSVHEYRLRPAT
jgi:RimJ/RimL family protein N-acetyltransferase